ncbi:MAG: energy transducer TonB [Paludibacteraceae bacterium]|nr:energy transducer TonB [Paludibacteraceae bacterium]
MKRLALLGICTLLCFPIFSQEEKVAEQVTNEDSEQSVATADFSQFFTEEDSSYVYERVDKKAEFPGGTMELMKFLKLNLNYPQEALEEMIQGRVYVQFVVKKNGEITDIVIAGPVHPLLDAEAVRVVKLMPKWIPAEFNGKAVNSRFTLPLLFKLYI